MRVMTRERRVGVELADDLLTYTGHSGKFMLKLIAAWIAMGFRRPERQYVGVSKPPPYCVCSKHNPKTALAWLGSVSRRRSRRVRRAKPAQGAHFVALDGMRARGAVVDPPDVEHSAVEVDLVPAQVADLGCP